MFGKNIASKLSLIACFAAILNPFASVTQAQNTVKKDPARKEFEACYVNPNRPSDSRFIAKDLRLNDSGGVLYTADVYKLNKSKGTYKYQSYDYKVKAMEKGKKKSIILGTFKIEYILKNGISNQQIWKTRFSGCGTKVSNQSYPIITYKFYDTTIGIKLDGFRSEKNFGDVTNVNPLSMFGAVNQLDAPDFGN
jgi:hypothetical protein